MRAALIAILMITSPGLALASNFNLYPGFKDRDAFVEMTSDKGLIVEIVLRCEREGNKVKAGIMTYSKVEKLFCSSKMYCTRDAEAAADDTCGY
ncbi:MAG: hypothetical protein HRU27_19155 [Rhizobiaceae bacterium]|nr:hypothetical protein [Hyphomicrobiales bacterium]NRB32713.1 hypothetical protein [Rhizobiaceae bacterium]